MAFNWTVAALLLASVVGFGGCKDQAPPAPVGEAAVEAQLVALEAFETGLLRQIDFDRAPTAEASLGADPKASAWLDDHTMVVVQSGRRLLSVVHDDGAVVAEFPAPRGARAVAVSDDAVYAVGDLSHTVMVYPRAGAVVQKPRTVVVDGLVRLGGVAIVGEQLVVSGEATSLGAGGLFVVPTRALTGPSVTPTPILRAGPDCRMVVATGDVIGTACPESHRAYVVSLAQAATWTFENDGPVWGIALKSNSTGVDVALTHIEDQPLDRSGGSFGHIDSMLTRVTLSLQRTPQTQWRESERSTDNLSALGVVIPKALLFDGDALVVTGAASGNLWRQATGGATTTVTAPPGVIHLARSPSGAWAMTSALLDRVEIVTGDRTTSVAFVDPVPRASDSRLGEALVFTALMAPKQQSDGALSRFSCEACHFEGGTDGRVHSTGRSDGDKPVVASTRPLWGLVNNTPLFTRALDKNLSRMVHAEFRVANSNSPQDPWFALDPQQEPMLLALGVHSPQAPIALRHALVQFLADFRPRPNPRTLGLVHLPEAAQRGLASFAVHCAACHAARRVGEEQDSAVPLDDLTALATSVLSEAAPLVWSTPTRYRTGVLPYVHEEGARASSLRRVSHKHPLFTTGVALTLEDVLLRFAPASHEGKATHAAPQPVLSSEERADLLAFLQLL